MRSQQIRAQRYSAAQFGCWEGPRPKTTGLSITASFPQEQDRQMAFARRNGPAGHEGQAMLRGMARTALRSGISPCLPQTEHLASRPKLPLCARSRHWPAARKATFERMVKV